MQPTLLYTVNHAEFFVSHRLPLAVEAMRRGYRVCVATSDTPAVDRLLEAGIEVIRLPLDPGGTNIIRDTQLLFSLIRLYKKLQPDIVHQVTIKPVMYGSLAACIARTPALVNAMSGLGYLYIEQGFKARFLRLVIERLLRLGMKHPNMQLILQNPDDQELFIQKKIVSDERICLIRGSGVDPDVFYPTPEPEEPLRVVFPARLLWDKGIGEFVAAARELKKKYPEVEFTIVGAADKNNPNVVEEQDIQAWVDEGFVQWWGMRKDMPEVFSQSHIVCLPSYREGLPKVLIEAAACGRALVSTDVPGCREIVKNEINGLLVPVKESKPLVEAISKLIESKDLRNRMGAEGRRIVLQSFALDQVVRQTLELYDKLLAQKCL